MTEPTIVSRVTIGLVSGQTLVGRVVNFSASQPDIAFETDAPSSTRKGLELLAAEKIAYVAIHIDPRLPPPLNKTSLQRYKIHVVGQKILTVQANPSAATQFGFPAYPAEPQSPFREYFFYHHGVLVRERDEKLGTMLVNAGVIEPEVLEQALQRQNTLAPPTLAAVGANPLSTLEARLEARGILPVDPRPGGGGGAGSRPFAEALPLPDLIERNASSFAPAISIAPLISVSPSISVAASSSMAPAISITPILTLTPLATSSPAPAASGTKPKVKRLGEMLTELNVISEQELAQTLARKFGLPVVDLDAHPPNPAAAKEIPRELIEEYGVLPIETSMRSLTVAISDPLALDAIDALRLHVQRRIDEVLVVPTQLKKFVADYLERPSVAPASTVANPQKINSILKRLSDGEEEDDDEEEESTITSESDSAIIHLVNQIILDAYTRGASDIHIEPNGKDAPTLVRLRIDGDCQLYQEIPPKHRHAIVARIKIMSKLDISERRKPQDGKFAFKGPDRTIELRVGTAPTVNGNEDVVMRILAGSQTLPLDAMKLSDRNLSELKRIITQPYGLILCVGPTGSGKTTTLHAALGHINTPDMKIWTAEDPVEITQAGLRQVQVSPRIGFTFAQAMRAFLRLDPDVIMIGEMRDEETAGTAIEASLTGHLVFSTLHTNSAPETVTRLLDMGLDPFSFGDALLGILAQRLARGLCPKCKAQSPAKPEELAQMRSAYGDELFEKDFPQTNGEVLVWRAKGCDPCGNSGYKGRIGLHELLVSDDPIRHAIVHKESVSEIRRIAIEQGMRTLIQDGIAKALSGATDLKQVFAVCSK